jgi:prolyl-tRNA synthetase
MEDLKMRMSKMHIHTLREVPTEAELPSHILLLRAGMIRKLVSGVYGFMPLGKRILRKIEEIIREEMDEKGAQEILMSALQPAELWQESGRWYAYGPELFRLKDRNDRSFCLGPTHEEIFTDIIRNEVTSYRQLPINLYQIQTKYRDEKRPRFGLMRSREFIMKDSYSFDQDQAGLDKSYDDMYEAYERIFTRCGLAFRAVEADSGAIGGTNTHEFTAISEYGESEIAYCDNCDFAATTERAECIDEIGEEASELKMEEVMTPECKTIAQVAEFLGVPTKQTMKALLYKAEDKFVAAFVRGDRELNEIKLINALNIPEHALEFADEAEMGPIVGCVAGYTGPMGLKNCTIIIDSELVTMKNLVAGANKENYHIKNVNFKRDFVADIITDIKLMKEGDPCPTCKKPVRFNRGIEVGQVFKLGTKYSESMKAYFKDENMQEKPIVMGCYGIGVTRTMAAIVEQHHDDNGIIWPISVAPFHVIITLVNINDEVQKELADEIYNELNMKGIEVILDDRDERPGVKFKDADLLGIPIRITVGKKAVEGIVEFNERIKGEKTELVKADAIANSMKTIPKERKQLFTRL